MIYILIPIVLIVGALGRRIAGGVLNQWFVGILFQPGAFLTLLGGDAGRVMGDTPARLIYGASMAVAALLAGAGLTVAALMIPAYFIGSTTGNFNSTGMGRSSTGFVECFLGMSVHAALTAVVPYLTLVALTMRLHGVSWLAFEQGGWLVGLCMLAAPLYDLAWCITGLNGKARFPNGFQQGPDLGEAFWGAATALGVFLTLWR